MTSFTTVTLKHMLQSDEIKKSSKGGQVARIIVMRNACKSRQENLKRRQDRRINNLKIYVKGWGHAVAQLFEALPKGRWLDSRQYYWYFSLT
jgi:hypothetical protein